MTAPVCFDNGEVDCNWAYKTYDMLYGYYRNSERYTIMYENAFKETEKELYSDMKVCDFETAEQMFDVISKKRKLTKCTAWR